MHIYVTTNPVAELLGCTVSTVRRYSRGEIAVSRGNWVDKVGAVESALVWATHPEPPTETPG
jgi:hypothetical protein